MKKSTVIALIAALSAIAGALAVVALYLRRREKELDEYEELLFGDGLDEDYEDDDGEYVAMDDEPADEAEAAAEPADADELKF